MSAARQPTFISFGEILYDVFPDGARLGGAPLNLAVHLHRLGAESVMISAVGDDPEGRNALAELKRQGLPCDCVATVPWRTGRVDVELDSDKVPSYRFLADCAYDHIPFPDAPISSPDVFCFGSLAQRGEASRRTLWRILDSIDSTIFFDVNLRQDFYSKEVLERSLRAADFVKLNEEELRVLSALFRIPETCDAIAEKFDLELVIRTLGPEGCEAWRRGTSIKVPAVPVKVVSTVGAGDAFSAAFLYEIESGASLLDAANAGSRLAAEIAAQTSAF